MFKVLNWWQQEEINENYFKVENLDEKNKVENAKRLKEEKYLGAFGGPIPYTGEIPNAVSGTIVASKELLYPYLFRN